VGGFSQQKLGHYRQKGSEKKTKKYGCSGDENSAEPTKVKPKSMGAKASTKCKTNASGTSGKSSKKSKKATSSDKKGSDKTDTLIVGSNVNDSTSLNTSKSTNVVSQLDNTAISCAHPMPMAFLNQAKQSPNILNAAPTTNTSLTINNSL
jgi:hypothetical protein